MTKLAAAIALLAIANSCSDPVDKAAKKRIFSPEDPPQVVASSAEKLDPGALGDQAQLARRVLRMGAAEAIERLGPHRFTATVSLAWTGGDQTEELKEKRALTAGAGGVAGDFHASLENSRDQGLEVIRVHNAVYARSRYGKFRQRLRDRGMAEKERDEVYGALRDFDAVFNGRLKLVSAGQVSIRGRTAIRYAASLAPQRRRPRARTPVFQRLRSRRAESTTAPLDGLLLSKSASPSLFRGRWRWIRKRRSCSSRIWRGCWRSLRRTERKRR
jgi:hypothetical protein